ncbi:Uncharacterized protein APZ42_033372 [Daphnia magna]|uniref:Uncharacterized protein n=1 Tax=Daphnia magna TaxID=35525 RepID=A0A164L594_9CRUS|nr:Uncharacterized protein APZ42_033372 [Daphnia magna]
MLFFETSRMRYSPFQVEKKEVGRASKRLNGRDREAPGLNYYIQWAMRGDTILLYCSVFYWVENTGDISTDFQNLELINEENQDRTWFYQQYGNTRITEIPVDDLTFELQYLLRNEKKIELTNKEVGTTLRAFLLTEPTILTPIELFKHCGLRSYYESTDSEYESVHSGEQQSRSESDLVPQSLVTLETEEETPKNSVPIKIVRAEIHTQVDQIPLDCPKSTPSTTTITCPAINHSQSSMNTQTPQSQLASTPCNYLPHQGLQGRKVSFTPASIVDQSNKII